VFRRKCDVLLAVIGAFTLAPAGAELPNVTKEAHG